MFKHILFPIDFSERCRAAEPFVASMAQRFNARLTLIHVVNIPAGWYGSMEAPYPVMFDIPEMLQAGKTQLNAFVAERELARADRVVEHGDPASQIVRFADQNGVDLVMMPTHGYGRFRSLLLGSVAAKVLHDATCAIWTAAHTEEPAAAGSTDLTSIICAVDFTTESVRLIRHAMDLAHEYKADLRLVHAMAATEVRSDKYRNTEFRRALMGWAQEQIAALQQQAGSNLEVCIDGGSVSTVVQRAVLHHNADLVVIGRGRIQETFGRLRSNAYAIIRESPCPVLSV